MSMVNSTVYNFTVEPFLSAWKKRIACWQAQQGDALVLDLCCGIGKQAEYLQLRGNDTVGIDLDHYALKYAQKRRSGGCWIKADATALPLKSKSFTQMNISLALHEKSQSQADQIMHELCRISAPGGTATILDFSPPIDCRSRWGWRFARIFEALAGPAHYKLSRDFMKRGGLDAFLKSYAFRVLRSKHLKGGSAFLVEISFDSGL